MIPKIRLVVEGAKSKTKMVLAVFDESEKAEKYIGDLLSILSEGFNIYTEELELKEDAPDAEVKTN